MGFEIDVAEDVPDNSEIEVLVYPSTEADVMDRKVDLNKWKVATHQGRVLVGTADIDVPELDADGNETGDTVEEQQNFEYTVLLMNNSSVPGNRSVIYGGASKIIASTALLATAILLY